MDFLPSPLPPELCLGVGTVRAPFPRVGVGETPVLPPQLLGLNLDPGIWRCEHSQLVKGRGVWGLEWEGPSRVTVSLSHQDPWNL